jgi:hypothetical protein
MVRQAQLRPAQCNGIVALKWVIGLFLVVATTLSLEWVVSASELAEEVTDTETRMQVLRDAVVVV